MKIPSLDSLTLEGKSVLIREDFNVPLKKNRVSDNTRIIRALDTVKLAQANGAKSITILSHLGRPKGKSDPDFSLKPVCDELSHLLDQEIGFNEHDFKSLSGSYITLCENVRFHKGETQNDPTFAQHMSEGHDVFVMDAFASAHRAHASTCGVTAFVPELCAGPLLSAEIQALDNALISPKHPIVAIVGGAKISSKLPLLKSLLPIVDTLIVGGGIANMLIHHAGYDIGNSLFEPDCIKDTQELMALAAHANTIIPCPLDVITTTNLQRTDTNVCELTSIDSQDIIVDIGPKTIHHYQDIIKKAQTIIFNGPVGIFETPAFAKGTEAIATAIAKNHGFSLAGGGDTIAAINTFDIKSDISYISTGGGAFLEYLQGIKLPGISCLEREST